MSDNREIRSVSLRATVQEDSRVVEGYALVFDSDSDLLYGEFIERIARSALDGVLERSDVFALLDHRRVNGVLARSKRMDKNASLTLTVDNTGLKYRFKAPKTNLGDETLEAIRRGDINGSSFAFSVAKDQWEKQPDGTYRRTILEFNELYDVSPVYSPAYEETSVALRKLGEITEAEKRALEEARAKDGETADDPPVTEKGDQEDERRDKENFDQYMNILKSRYQ